MPTAESSSSPAKFAAPAAPDAPAAEPAAPAEPADPAAPAPPPGSFSGSVFYITIDLSQAKEPYLVRFQFLYYFYCIIDAIFLNATINLVYFIK